MLAELFARIVLKDILKVHPDTLAELKSKLKEFDSRSKKWKEDSDE